MKSLRFLLLLGVAALGCHLCNPARAQTVVGDNLQRSSTGNLTARGSNTGFTIASGQTVTNNGTIANVGTISTTGNQTIASGGNLTVASGAAATIASGGTLTVSGTLSGAPTGGTLNLGSVTLTLPSATAALFQPIDADLTSIAALSTTSFGRGLLTESSATTARGTLGVAIGTNVQAWDADLDAIAALATTSFGRSLLTESSAATAFSTLKQAASTSATGVVEIATSAETGTATDTGRVVSPIALREVDNARALPLQLIGYVVRGTGSTASGGFFGFYNEPALVDSLLDSVSGNFGTTGSWPIYILQNNGNGTYTATATFTLTVSATGPKTFRRGTDFGDYVVPSGGFVGFYAPSSGARVTYTSTQSKDILYIGSEPVVGTPFSVSTFGGNRQYFSATLRPISTSTTAAERNEAPQTARTNLETVSSFGSLPQQWIGTGWTFGSGIATSSSTGLSNALRGNGSFGIDRRIITWDFELTTSSSVVALVTYPVDGGAAFGSMVRIDASGSPDQIQIYTYWTGSNTPTSLQTKDISFTLAADKRYRATWEKNGREFTFTIAEKNGPGSTSLTRAAYYGWTVYSSNADYDQGAMQGAPGFAVISGGARVYSYAHDALCSQRPLFYGVGDSLIEGFTVPDHLKFAAQMAKDFGADQVVTSGVGSTASASAVWRAASELLKIRPRYAMIYVGTNSDSELAANLSAWIEAAQSVGATPLVAIPPTSSSAATTINALTNTFTKIRYDLSHTATGIGSSLVAAYYSNVDAAGSDATDNIHDNVAGNRARYERLKIDVPSMWSYRVAGDLPAYRPVPLTTYAAGTAYTLTNSSAALDFGTTDPVLVFTEPGTYRVQARVVLKTASATIAGETATLKLRRTNNTAADLSDSSTTFAPRAMTTTTETLGAINLPVVYYTTTAVNDSVTLYGVVSATLGAGTITATEASIVAERIY